LKYSPIAALALLAAFALPVHAEEVAHKPAAAKPAVRKPAKPKAEAPKADDEAPGAKDEAGKAAEPAKDADAKAPRDIRPKNPLPTTPLTREEAVSRANAFFNASPVMTADFVQIGGDGKRSEGRLHVQRAGRVRFEYAQPASMEVVSDGAQVAVRDRKLGTQDLYFINQTPLKFLMKEKIDLEKDVTVEGVSESDAGVIIDIIDKATFGGTSKVKLIFDRRSFKLKQWQITDPQGYETLISLFNIDQTKTPDPGLFKLK